ncbi:alpha-galactosidase [Arthrobacter sp. B2a2-09]|uniref:alpha-galactosidase n=1 Tax=Arthrobacter sp. B2a2-09 TaxID=2952822 RepID=UPI0022CD4C14|nr:alpha-galactosidase [Arthrobacter sp. B2a2-09]MCZ9880972.1 alpha-galactosidase [Arthrobacter sp. B2a2-09]
MAGQWTLSTKNSDYVVSLLPNSSGLVLDHWGKQLTSAPQPWSEPDIIPSFRFAADIAPLELAALGDRQVDFSELVVIRENGLTGSRWHLAPENGVDFDVTAERSLLRARFVDESGDLQLTLFVQTDSRHDAVRRHIEFENNSTRTTVWLRRAYSAGWPLPVGRDPQIHYLAGTWAQEFTPQTATFGWGSFGFGSRHGTTGPMFAPVVTANLPASAASADAYSVALEWSGNWRANIESTPASDRLRVSLGADDDTLQIALGPGERFTSPPAVGVFSSDGADGVAAAWHEYQRVALTRDLTEAHRPVVYNSWYATEFDVDLEQQRTLAKVAAELGTEVFVLDDGWFKGRKDDTSGLGDWVPDVDKFPNGLDELAQHVLSLGMRFGLWVEPEAVNPESDLFREQPEWIYRAGDRPLLTSRNQYVLDFGRADVIEFIKNALRQVLMSAPITYLKWDMNRPISDGGRAGDAHSGEWSLQHTRGYYEVMRMLREEFPNVTIEACASGGARIDNAVLALSDVVWPSDETGPRDRLAIQHGFLSAYPAHVMSSWVTEEAGHRDRSSVSLEYRFVVAMAGVLGIGADISRWSLEERSTASRMVQLYKSVRNVIHRGRVVRHGLPSDQTYSVEYADPASGLVVVLVYDRDRDRCRDQVATRVRPRQLREGITYRLNYSDAVVDGDVASTVGVVVPFAIAEDADVLIFEPCK